MAAQNWRTNHTLGEITVAPGTSWCQFQLVNMILAQSSNQSFHDFADVERAISELVRFESSLSSDFAPGVVRKVTLDEDQQKTTTHFVAKTQNSFSGTDGALSETINEHFIASEKRGETTELSAFLQIFQQRIQLLHYLLKATSDNTLMLCELKNSDFGRFILSLSDESEAASPTAQEQLARPALMADSRSSFDQARGLFASLMSLTLKSISPLRGGWRRVNKADHTRLGQSNSRLKHSVCLGSRMWDQMAEVEWIFHQVPVARKTTLLPGGEEHPLLQRIFQRLCRGRFRNRITFRFEKEPVEPATFGCKQGNFVLGFNSVLGAKPRTIEELSFNLELKGAANV